MPNPQQPSNTTANYICPTCETKFTRWISQISIDRPTCSKSCNAIARTGFRSLNLKHNFFNKINTHNKAYILGLIFADGNVSKCLKQWSIDLHEQDEELILEIARNLGIKITNPLPKQGRCVRLKIRSQQQTNQLFKFGCIPNKTYNYSKIIFPPSQYEPSFWRGFFDGDGSICVSVNHGIYKISFACSHPFLSKRLKQISFRLGTFYRHNLVGILKNISFHGSDAQKWASYLQSTPSLRMKRKATACNKLINLKIHSRITKIKIPHGMRWCSPCKKFYSQDKFYESNRCKPCSRKHSLASYYKNRVLKRV